MFECDLTVNGIGSSGTCYVGQLSAAPSILQAWGVDTTGNDFCCEQVGSYLPGVAPYGPTPYPSELGVVLVSVLGGPDADLMSFQYPIGSPTYQLHSSNIGGLNQIDLATIEGGDGGDTIWGSEYDGPCYYSEVLVGGFGSDEIHGGAGDDELCAVSCSSSMTFPYDRDQLWGGGGADTIYGSSTVDEIDGGEGSDIIYAEAGDDTIYGGDESSPEGDIIYGCSGYDTIWGEGGDDVIYVDECDSSTTGTASDNWVDAGDGEDWVYGGTLDDVIYCGDQRDRVFACSGDDTIWGQGGDDILLLGHCDTTTIGSGGTNWVHAGDGQNTVTGSHGNDTIISGSDADLVYGGPVGSITYATPTTPKSVAFITPSGDDLRDWIISI